jgi:hypothetical protein
MLGISTLRIVVTVSLFPDQLAVVSDAGHWQLQLAPGRSTEIFDMIDGDLNTLLQARHTLDGFQVTVLPQSPVLIHSLSGLHMRLLLHKKKGFEGQDVLKVLHTPHFSAGLHLKLPVVPHIACANLTQQVQQGLADSMAIKYIPARILLADCACACTESASACALQVDAKPNHEEGEVINIFAIASGHMYERLQKIMMLSVLKHTKSKVKFWLIKNYMSPEMKLTMPLMAKEYGFEVWNP